MVTDRKAEALTECPQRFHIWDGPKACEGRNLGSCAFAIETTRYAFASTRKAAINRFHSLIAHSIPPIECFIAMYTYENRHMHAFCLTLHVARNATLNSKFSPPIFHHPILVSPHIPRTQPRKRIRTMPPTIRKPLKIHTLLADMVEPLRLLLRKGVHAGRHRHRRASLWDISLLLLLLGHCAVFGERL